MKSINTGKGTLNYQEHGEGFPVLFLHSYLWDSNMWSPQFSALSEDYRCIAPDLWGHGGSMPSRPLNCSMEDIAQDVHDFALSLGLHQYAVVGLSIGAIIGAHLAIECPQNVAALVMMDTFVGAEAIISQGQYMEMLQVMEQTQGIPHDLAMAFVNICFADETLRSNKALVGQALDYFKSIKPEQIGTMTAIGRAVFFRSSLMDALPKIVAPTMIMVGDDDKPTPLAKAELMHENMIQAQLEVIGHAGHLSNLENPKAVNTKLSSFLGAVPDIALIPNAELEVMLN